MDTQPEHGYCSQKKMDTLCHLDSEVASRTYMRKAKVIIIETHDQSDLRLDVNNRCIFKDVANVNVTKVMCTVLNQ